MHLPRRRVALVAACFGLSLLSCGREVTGPENGFPYGRTRMAELALAPEFPALPGANLASDVEPFERVRLTLVRLDGTVAKDTLIDFPSTSDSLTLALDVPLPLTAPDSGVTMSLALRYVNAAGDTVFRGGPIPVRVRGAQGGQPAPPVTIPVTWVPNGPVPASVVLLPDSGGAVAGTATTFTATAFDAGGQPIAGAPILFASLDTTRARVQAPGSGVVTWRAVRGIAPIAAFALNGVSDTSRFTVALPAALVLPASGTAQSAPVRQPLAAPVELRVTAADSVPVAGVRVDFVVATGGGTLTALADTSDANGLVSTGWTLGSTLGAQTMTATIAGVAASARTITATATEAVPAALAFLTQPLASVAAGVAMPDIAVEVRDGTGTRITTFTGAVTGRIALGPPGTENDSSRTVNAVAGVATFAAPDFERAGTYVLGVTTAGVAEVLSDTFTVTAAAAAQLLRDSTSGDGQAGLPGAALAQPLRVRVTDAFGNAVAGTVVTWATTGGTLGAPTSTSAADGYAANTLTLPSVAGAVQVTATAAGLGGSPQAFTLTVSAGAPTQLALVSTFPALSAGQVVPDVIVQARDAAGNLAPSYNGLVFARVLTGPNGPDTDSVTVTAVNGVATFTGQTFETAGTYTVRFNAPGLTDAVSPAITVTAAAATQLVVASFPDSVTTGAAIPPFVIEARDAFGNVELTFTGTVTAAITTGPVGGPLGGTLARAAVAGVATFDDLQLTLVGSYRLGFTAGALTPTSADLVAWLGAPAGLAIAAGDAQTAPAFTTLGDSLAVRVTDLGGNPVPGVTTTWSVATGGGTLSSASVTTGADGRAAVLWTLGGTVGGQTVTASAGALGPVTFVANATAAAPMLTWTGAASTAWDDPANWSPARVPTATDSVYFPAAAAQMPVVTVQPEVRALVNDNASPITMSGGNWLYVRQRLVLRPDVAGIACGTGTVVASPLSGTDTTRVQGRLDCSVRHEFGTVLLTDSLVSTGPLAWLSGSARVVPAGHRLRATRLLVGDAAALVMTNAADTVVADSATFNGASTAGLLTAGVLQVRGHFAVGGNPAAFAASGTHRTEFLAGAADTAQVSVGDPASSALADAYVDRPLRVLNALPVNGDALVWYGGRIVGAAGRLRVGGTLTGVTGTLIAPRVVELGGVLADTGAFRPDTTVFTGTGQVMPFQVGANRVDYRAVRIAGTVNADFSAGADSIGGPLRVEGVFSVSETTAGSLAIAGDLAVQGAAARLFVGGAPHTITVHGDALFDGAASDDDLGLGTLRVARDFTQLATWSPRSFRPATAHTTYLDSAGTASFADAVESRFGRLGIQTSGVVRTFATDVGVADQLLLMADGAATLRSTLLGAGGTRRIVANGLDQLGGAAFENVALRIEGTAPINTTSTLTFSEFDPTVVQLELARANGATFLYSPVFSTTPAGAGRYLRVFDTDAADGQPYAVNVDGLATPQFHGGFAEAVAPAVLNGWLESANFVWTGAVDGTWTNPANWSGNQVPAATDSVLVPAGLSPSPVVPANTTLRAFVSQRTETPIGLLGNLTITGRLVLPTLGGIACSAGAVQFDNTVTPAVPMAASGRVACFTRLLHGTVVVGDTMTIVGNDVQVENDAVLAVTEDLLTVEGQFATMNSGLLRMQADSAHVWLQQGATFDGGSTAGQLTAGTLSIGGNFTQGNTGAHGEAFAPSGAHVTEIIGAQNQQVVFATPGTNAGQSHFHTLAIGQPAGATSITLNSDVYATGALRNGPGPQKFLTAPVTVVLATAGAEYGGAAFDNVRWELLDGAAVTGILGGFSFTNMPTGQPQLYIARTGGTIQFENVEFDVVPTTGAFLQVEDLDNVANGVLTISMNNTTPAFHSGRAVLLGGAQLLGWPQDPNFTWTGAVSTDWTNPANWSDGVVPTGADSVFVPAGTPASPVIAADTAVRALTLAAGATLDHEGVNLTVNGSVDVGLGGSISGAGGRLNLYGTGAHTLRGAIGAARIDGGTYALAGGTQVTGQLDVYNGDLAIGGFGLVSTGSLYIGINGTMTMTDPAGVADFAGTVTFNGTSTAGRLTAGTLRVAGDFEQLSSSGGPEDLSFAASGGHIVELAGTATQVIRFDTPDSTVSASCATSCFANLYSTKSGGGVRFRTSAKALGDLDLGFAGDSVVAITTGGVRTHLVAGGQARFGVPLLRAGSIAWRQNVETAATTIQVDSLIAWGTDTLLVGFDSVRTVMLGDYRLRGTLAGPLEARAQLDIDGTARVAGSLYTRGPGTLRMTEPTDTIVVEGVSDFGGGATAGLLTAGAYRAGNVFRTSATGAYAASGTHRTFFDDLCTLCDGYQLQAADSLSRFQHLDITGGNWTIQPGSAPIVVLGDLEVRSILQGNPFVRVGGTFFMYGTSQTDLQHLSVAGTLGLRAGFLADTLTYAGTGQSLNATGVDGAQIIYQHVEVRGQVLASPHPTVVTQVGTLTVNGGDLLVGNVTDTDSTRVQVGGPIATTNGGRLGMQNDLAWISTGSNATFAGGSTDGLLTAGRLMIGGNFTQSGDNASFAASGTHVTQFATEGAQSIDFTAPGAGTSHFNHLEIAQAPSSRVDLLSPVHALGQLRAAHAWETVIRSGAARTLTAGGANLQDVRFDRVALALVDGDAIEGMDQLTFDSLPATAVQLQVDRSGGAVLLAQPEFVVPPTGAGRFLVANDAVVNGDPLTITVDTPLPAAHGGYITQTGEAVIAGWDASAVINWTGNGTLYDWNDPANWDAGRVPTFADDVVIPGAAPVSPIVNGPETIVVRSLRNEHNTALIVTGDLIVRGSFLNPWLSEASVSCDGGTIGFAIDPDSVAEISGAMTNCDVAMTSGTLRVADSTIVRLMAVGGGLLELNGQRMRVQQDFTTTGTGRLSMVNAADTLEVNGSVIFAGQSIAATMTDGTLRVAGDFTQLSLESAASFRAQAAHAVEFFGTGTSNISVQEPGLLQSAFAYLRFNKGTGGVVNVDAAGAYATVMQVLGGTVNLNAGSTTTVTGSVNLFLPGLLNLFGGAALSIGGGCSGNTGVFTNLGGTLTGGPCP